MTIAQTPWHFDERTFTIFDDHRNRVAILVYRTGHEANAALLAAAPLLKETLEMVRDFLEDDIYSDASFVREKIEAVLRECAPPR
jgi:hypothetical protein